VLLDYAHNAHGMDAMAKMIRALGVTGRRIGVVSAPGDRRDEDILALGRIAAGAFDLVLLREDDDLRGRRPGEVGALLRRGFLAAGSPAARTAPGFYGEGAAVERGLEPARPGDLLVIFGDALQRDWEQIVGLGPQPAAATPPRPLFAPQTQPLWA